MSTNQEKRPNRFLLYGFIALVTIAAIAIAFYTIPQYLTPKNLKLLFDADGTELSGFIILLVILSVSNSYPLPNKHKDDEFNISTIIIYSAILYREVGIAVLLVLLSSLFTFTRRDDKRISHIFNTPIYKTLFNVSSIIVALYLGWLCFHATYPFQPQVQGKLMLPQVLLPSLIYLLVFLLVNSLIPATLFSILSGKPFIQLFLYGVTTMMPTLLMLAPLGFLLAFFFLTNPYIALLFFIPLMFARYAFKLYLDSREKYMKTISTLTTAIEAKDQYTEGHSRRVGEYAVEIATFMGIKGTRIENIKVAAVLHDIGKIGIEDEILRKPGKLSPEEWDRIRQHPSIGVHILEEVEMPQSVKDMIEYHHLHYDHSGYPPKSGDREIPMEVHIITLADAYDAMTSDRPYRRALSEEIALQNIVDGRGSQFHPDVVDAFLKMKATATKH